MAGTFNQSLQCTQDVFIGFQAPSPPVNPVRVPNSVVANGILILLMEGPIRPYQCLIWANQGSLPPYHEDPAPLFWHHGGHVLIQIGPSFKDIDGEYGGAVEVDEENVE